MAGLEVHSMGSQGIGVLEPVELRQVWSTEAGSFTPWLIESGSLKLLGQAIGIELSDPVAELNVGPYRADIRCRDTLNDTWVLIENQLDRTDHSHLGQLLTYAAGIEAVTLVWIARSFTDEHRATIDWLNRITNDGLNFIGIEIELWRIGQSLPAPRFNIVAKPNEWYRVTRDRVQQAAAADEGERQQFYSRYWDSLAEKIKTMQLKLQPRLPSDNYGLGFPIGRSRFRIEALAGRRDGYIAAEVQINHPDAEFFYSNLLSQRDEIEAEFGEVLNWHNIPGQIRKKIGIYKRDVTVSNEEDWPEQHSWLINRVERLDQVFRSRIKELPTPEAKPGDQSMEKLE